jgi:carbamate kinase
MKRVVIALGGNALGKNCQEQRELVAQTAVPLVDLVETGLEVVLSHGNGPQVGMINLAFAKTAEGMPFPECGAMSQGYIGYHLQNAIYNELAKRGLQKPCASIVTQVLVDADDPAFFQPTKPVGPFYTAEEAERLAAVHPNHRYVEDAGRGYRRVVASPKPVDIIEKDLILDLVSQGYIVVAAGGGGIPVIQHEGRLEGVAAVIDKDFASARLAELVEADTLIILTAVDQVAINFGKPDQEELREVSVSQMRTYADQGQFAPGSMLPKVEAAMQFVTGAPGRKALITSLEKAAEGLAGKAGTLIVND